jgi:hypothetical protein
MVTAFAYDFSAKQFPAEHEGPMVEASGIDAHTALERLADEIEDEGLDQRKLLIFMEPSK